jgi:catechol-2,3-dioxygenase
VSGSAEPVTGTLHHVELWVADLERAAASWGWLLEALGYQPFQRWAAGRSWRLGETYIVLEQSPAMRGDRHDRHRPGLNHLAFHVATSDQVDDLVARAGEHGWALLFADRHPHAGGAEHYAGYLEDADGFEVELVARPVRASAGDPASR